MVLSSRTAAEASGPKLRRKIPDATSSPYFGLDRHLTQKGPSGRKRLLKDLNESGSPFVQFQMPQPPKPAANIRAQRIYDFSEEATVEGTDLFGMSPLKKNMSQSGGGEYIDINIMDSVSTVDLSDDKPDEDDVDSMNYTNCVEKQSSYSLTIPARPSPNAAESDNSRGKRYKASDSEFKTPGATSKESPRYTVAGSWRKTVRRMKY